MDLPVKRYMLTDEERMKLAERWVELSPKGI